MIVFFIANIFAFLFVSFKPIIDEDYGRPEEPEEEQVREPAREREPARRPALDQEDDSR